MTMKKKFVQIDTKQIVHLLEKKQWPERKRKKKTKRWHNSFFFFLLLRQKTINRWRSVRLNMSTAR